MKAIWKDTIIAESEKTIFVEGNHYFPPNSINQNFFQSTSHHTTCPWKGNASYYNLTVNDEMNSNAAWYYPNPSSAASNIKDYVAFWKGVRVEK
jgi:uncharacterized protein (DUF427 family)